MYDRTGGPLVYVREAMGKTAGFSVGWMVWVTYLVGWAVLSNGLVGYLGSLWSPAETYKIPIIIVLVGLLCLLNTLGVRLGSRIIQFFTVAKLIPLALLVVAGLTFAGTPGNGFLGQVPGGGDFFAAVLILIFAYGGPEGGDDSGGRDAQSAAYHLRRRARHARERHAVLHADPIRKRRTPVQGYRIELEGTRAEEYPRRYTHIKVRHIVSGQGIMQRSLEKAVNLSHEKYCSVAASLNAEIEAETIIEE